MKLTQEKLIETWKVRKQIFEDPKNQRVVEHYNKIEELFNEISNVDMSWNESEQCYESNGTLVKKIDGASPSQEYFGCAIDEMTAPHGFDGINKMCNSFPVEFQDLIMRIGCMLGGFSFEEPHTMHAEYRIISNKSLAKSDEGTLTSMGISRHPSSNFADNNYFFNVIKTINDIRNDSFNLAQSKIVLRYPTNNNPQDSTEIAKQRDILNYRFPYKFFYMWTHKDVLHLMGLMVYQNLVKQEDERIGYKEDSGMDQQYASFIDRWKEYSERIGKMIPDEEKGNDFWNELSKLLSIIMTQETKTKEETGMEKYISLLESNKNLILTGAPGTGKTYLAKRIAEQLGATGERYGFVQFHPSLDYTDFVEGLRPVSDNQSIAFERKDGIFMDFCRKALKAYKEAENKSEAPKYVFVIDEINRGEISKIFGELFFAIDPGYRGPQGKVSTQYSNLWTEPNDLFDGGMEFYIPENVYIIGTMNDIDRSVECMDFAMRRRFAFKEVLAADRFSMIKEDKVLGPFAPEIQKRMDNLNSCILMIPELSTAYQIGAAYYLKLKNYLSTDGQLTDESWNCLWNNHLQGLLFEYLRGQSKASENLEALKKAFFSENAKQTAEQ